MVNIKYRGKWVAAIEDKGIRLTTDKNLAQQFERAHASSLQNIMQEFELIPVKP